MMFDMENFLLKLWQTELGKSLIFGFIITMLVLALGYSGNNSYKVDFTPKELKRDIINIINSNKKFNDEKDFIENNSFSYKTKSDLNKLLNNSDKIKDEELINIYFVVKDKFPSLISGKISKESERWSSWIYIVIIYILSTLFSWVFLYLLSIKDDLKHEVNIHFMKIIQDFANTHPGFIKGIYDNYPHHFTEIFDDNKAPETLNKRLHPKSQNSSNGNSIRSLHIWMENVDVNEYSELAKELLDYTSESIFSTTYFDNSDLITALKKEKVMDWINAVKEQKQKHNNINIFRVHIFKDVEDKNDSKSRDENDPKSFNGFINLIKKDNDAKNIYLEYVNSSDEYRVWLIQKDMDRHFFGEYIIFDEQVMIQYDEDFKKLELYIGSIVKQYAQKFNKHKNYFAKNKAEELINELKT